MSRVFSNNSPLIFGSSLAAMAYGVTHLDSPLDFALNATCIAVGALGLFWQAVIWLDNH